VVLNEIFKIKNLTYINKNVNICTIQKIMLRNILKEGEIYAS